MHPGRMDIGEIMGTTRLFDWAHENPRDQHGAVDTLHDPQVVAALGASSRSTPRSRSISSGQVNAESVDGRQVAGIGGQFDFVLGASRAAGGRSIIALPSTGRGGDGLAHRAAPAARARAVTTPRYLVGLRGDGVRRGRAAREKATPGGRASSSASPTRRSARCARAEWRRRQALEPLDLGEDLLVRPGSGRSLILVDALPVDVDGEDATGRPRSDQR